MQEILEFSGRNRF